MPTNEPRILSGAWHDFYRARSWYEDEREDLAYRFEAALDTAVAEILRSPQSWPRLGRSRKHRYRLLRSFPFYIVYFIDGSEVVITAIAHMKRRPGYWRKRRRR